MDYFNCDYNHTHEDFVLKCILTSPPEAVQRRWFDKLTMTGVILSLPKDCKEGLFYNDSLFVKSLIICRQTRAAFIGFCCFRAASCGVRTFRLRNAHCPIGQVSLSASFPVAFFPLKQLPCLLYSGVSCDNRSLSFHPS